MTADHITEDQVVALLHQAELVPDDWDVATIAGKATRWIASNLIELSEMAGWDPVDQAAHLAEFGSLAAVDFMEQCVIEAGPAAAPWRELQMRVDAGEFDTWPPVWIADRQGAYVVRCGVMCG